MVLSLLAVAINGFLIQRSKATIGAEWKCNPTWSKLALTLSFIV